MKLGKRGTIGILIALMTTSGTIRLVAGATEAIAASDFNTVQQDPTGKPVTGASGHPRTEQLSQLLTDLQRRERELEQKEVQFAKKEARLQLAQAKIEVGLNELTMAEQKLRETMALSNSAAENDLKQLTAVYENMKPASAASLFSEMTPSFSAGFVARLSPDIAAKILAKMSPDKAYAISSIVAGRNADAIQTE